MSFFEELKRRRVFKVAGIYVVAMFATLQGVQVLAESLALPAWTMTMLTLIALVAFPIVVVLAWVFDVTPAGVQRAAPIAGINRAPLYAGLGVIIALVGFGAYSILPETETETETETERETASSTSIAVLPFVDMSPEKDQEYFGDGITEEILNVLAKLPDLRVPGRTSSFSFKDRNLSIREIAQQLNVRHVLEGSVRKSGDSIRITAQLIDARTDKHIWSDQYDRRMADAFAVQGEIAHAIVAALQLRIGADTRLVTQETADPRAHELYLKGLYIWRKRGSELPQALSAFRAATRADSNYARAHAGVAMTYGVLPQYTNFDFATAIREGKLAAHRALELDPKLADAHAALGEIAVSLERDWKAAERHLDEAVRLDSRSAWAHFWRAGLLEILGRYEEALEANDRAIELDPLNHVMLLGRAELLVHLGRSRDGIDLAKAIVNNDPNRRGTRMKLVALLVLERRFDEAVAFATQDSSPGSTWSPERWGRLIRAVQNPDSAATAQRILSAERVSGGNRFFPWFAIPYYRALGTMDSVAVLLERGADRGDQAIAGYARDPAVVKALGSNPHFQAFVSKMNLSAEATR